MPHQCTNCGHTFPDGSKEMLSGCPQCGGNKFQFTPASAVGSPAADGTSQPQPASGSQSRSQDQDQSQSQDKPTSPAQSPSTTDSSDRGPTARAAKTVRNWVSDSRSETDGNETEGDSETDRLTEWPDTAKRRSDSSDRVRDAEESGVRSDPSQPTDGEGDEDSAQASARSDVVSPDELPSARVQSDGVSSDTDSDSDSDSEPASASEEEESETNTNTNSSSSPTQTPPSHGRVVSEPDEDAPQPSLEELREELNDQFESIKVVNPGQYELNLMELYDREEHIVSLQEDGRYVINVPDSWREGPKDE